MAAERGMTIIPPYDHPHVVAGQGTVGLELMQAAHELGLYICLLWWGWTTLGLCNRSKAPSVNLQSDWC